MTRRTLARGIALAAVLGAALAAYAVGNGDITATPAVTVITITSPTGTASGNATLANTTAATTYNVAVGSDASCDPTLTFMVSGGNPVAIGPGSSRSVQIGCPARGTAAMRRCLYHAKNNTNGAALADFMSVCLYGSAMTLVPQQTSLDFGTVAVGDNAMLELGVRNDGAQPITRVYLQTTDLGGNFQIATPCNPDAAFCDADITAVPAGGTLPLQIKCTPQGPGMHSAQLHIGTDTFQLLAQPITLTCMGSPSATPALGANPSVIELPPVDVLDGSASTSVHLANIGDGTVVIRDVRVVDVDLGAATDWTYTASGECTGTITTSCSLEAGEAVDIALTFDPSAIGRRRATLLISYRDTVDRTKEIPLLGTGLGATLELLGSRTSVAFGMVPIGRSSTMDLALVNRGNRDITAQLGLTTGTTPPFSVLPGASAVVVPTVPKTVSITCAPTVAGIETATLAAEAMDAFGGAAITVNARCEGSTLELFANPTALDLGEIRLGAGEVRRTIQLLSTGGVLTLAGQPEQEAANAAVSIGPLSQSTTPATFDVVVTPASEGEIATTIAVSDDDGNTLRIPVTGRVVDADYEATTKVDLGTFCVNQPTTSSNASLASIGTGTIALTAPTLGGTPSPFELTATSPPLYPTTLPPTRTATVAITPRRQAVPAELSDMLYWHTDVDGAPTATTALSARFIDQGGAIAPPALDFGKVVVHLYSENGQRVVIQNCNPTPLVLDPPMIKTPFSIDSPNFPAMLNPNETVTFSVGFHPTRIGIVTHTLRITSPQLPGAPLEVLLVGEGVTTEMPTPDAGTDNKDKDTSFYACSCKSSRPSGVVPIVLAIMGVAFPRRRPRRRRPANQLP